MSALKSIKDMELTGARKTREFCVTEPIYIKKLTDRLGPTKSGELIGVSASAISRYLSIYQATKPMELAAQLVYEQNFPKQEGGVRAPKPVAAIVQGDLHHIKTIKDMVEVLGGKFTFLEL